MTPNLTFFRSVDFRSFRAQISEPRMTDSNDEQSWSDLHCELDLWRQAGDVATVWWRDDDASRGGPELDRLISVSAQTSVPAALAVVPAWLDGSLGKIAEANENLSIIQHGWEHVNHNPKGTGYASEFGKLRSVADSVVDLERGRDVLRDAFGNRALLVLAPPWNRISEQVAKELPQLGFAGLSYFGTRRAMESSAGFHVHNCHCDPIRWKGEPRFRGVSQTLAMLIEHLRARRERTVDPAEATGVLTHHLDMDDQSWDFVVRLFEVFRDHPGVAIRSAEDLFVS